MSVQEEVPEPLRNNSVEARIIKQKIWDRLWRDNEHFMCAIVGREGSGKSYTGMKLAEVADPTFDAMRVMFDPQSFLERLQEWKKENETRGKMVVIDEAGVGIGVRTWHDKDQILFNQVLQIIRDENMGVIFTLPRLTELDSQTRGRLHAMIEMVDKENDEWARVKWLNWDPTRDDRNKIYRKYPILKINGHERKIKRLRLSPPSDDLVEAYSERKDTFQDQTYQEAIDEMGEDEADDEKTVKEVAQEIEDDVSDFVSSHSHTGELYIDKELIRAEYETSHRDANAVKSLLEKRFSEEDLQNHA